MSKTKPIRYTVYFSRSRMEALVKQDTFLLMQTNLQQFSGRGRDEALRVVFDTYVVGDTEMTRLYQRHSDEDYKNAIESDTAQCKRTSYVRGYDGLD